MVTNLDVPNLSPHGGNVWELLSITSRPNRKRWIELKQMSQITDYASWKRAIIRTARIKPWQQDSFSRSYHTLGLDN